MGSLGPGARGGDPALSSPVASSRRGAAGAGSQLGRSWVCPLHAPGDLGHVLRPLLLLGVWAQPPTRGASGRRGCCVPRVVCMLPEPRGPPSGAEPASPPPPLPPLSPSGHEGRRSSLGWRPRYSRRSPRWVQTLIRRRARGGGARSPFPVASFGLGDERGIAPLDGLIGGQAGRAQWKEDTAAGPPTTAGFCGSAPAGSSGGCETTSPRLHHRGGAGPST